DRTRQSQAAIVREWVRRGLPKANGMIQWIIPSDKRREPKRAAGRNQVHHSRINRSGTRERGEFKAAE
ncbi:MAG: hypothetical protein J0I19_17680, partial [Alphaproteobacteria bacterium]|nr:hypothetical protein [Alphaproteobacteria bacterium]